MSALTVRELSENTLRTLRARAAYNHRSLNGEVPSLATPAILSGRRDYAALRKQLLKI